MGRHKVHQPETDGLDPRMLGNIKSPMHRSRGLQQDMQGQHILAHLMAPNHSGIYRQDGPIDIGNRLHFGHHHMAEQCSCSARNDVHI